MSVMASLPCRRAAATTVTGIPDERDRHHFAVGAGRIGAPVASRITRGTRELACAEVEKRGDERAIDVRDSYVSRNARRVGRPDEMRRSCEIEGAVLHVEDHEIEPRGGAQLHDHRAAGEDDAPRHDVTGGEALAHARAHQLHVATTQA